MKKTFFMVYVEGENAPVVKHDTREKADQEAQCLANKYGKKAHVMESITTNEPDEINVKVYSLETACEYLGRMNKACMCGMPDKHAKAMAALYTLIIIAEAWNKADGFVPDYDNTKQDKWFPWFKKTPAGFVFANASDAASYAAANLGSRLCFKDSNRARQFGEQFIDMWNDFLLFR